MYASFRSGGEQGKVGSVCPASSADSQARGGARCPSSGQKPVTGSRKVRFVPREGFLFRQSPHEARPSRRRKKPLPGATVTSGGFRSLAAGKAMSKGRAEAATGGTRASGAGETRRGAGKGAGGRLSDPSPVSSPPVAPGVLLKYLQEQNRPYSAQDVFGNLQREHGLGKAVRTRSRGSSPGDPSSRPL